MMSYNELAMLEKRPFLVWGSSGHAKVLLDILEDIGGKVVALFDNNPKAESIVNGAPLFHGLNGWQQWLAGNHDFAKLSAAVAIGGAKGKERLDIANLLVCHGINMPSLRHSSSVASSSAKWGFGCHLLAGTVVAADVVIGDMCIINNNATVDHECLLGNGVHIAPGSTLCGCVTVGDHSMIGAGSVVLPRVKIGCNTIIGAGSVVTKDVGDNQIFVGNPARPLLMT